MLQRADAHQSRPSLRALALRLALRPLLGPEGHAASVVIATWERCTYLDLTLASLERQTVPRDLWEVVVADNASRDDTPAVLERYASRLNLRTVRLPERAGYGAALQAATDAARGTVLVFLGEDCLAAPDFLLRHLLRHVREGCVVIGDTRLHAMTHLYSQPDATVVSCPPQPLLSPEDLDTPHAWRDLLSEAGPDYRELGDAPDLWRALTTRNFSVRRDRLAAAGVWNAEIEGRAGLEQNVASRLRGGGARFLHEAKTAVVGQTAPPRSAGSRIAETDRPRDKARRSRGCSNGGARPLRPILRCRRTASRLLPHPCDEPHRAMAHWGAGT